MTVHQSPVPFVWAACARPDDPTLQSVLRNLGWRVCVSCSIRETLAAARDNRLDVVICDEELTDGGWKDLLAGFAHFPCPPSLIVISERLDSSLWAEVLNLGGFDVLLRPLKENEIAGVLHMAHRHRDKRKYAPSVAASSARVKASTAA
ncbi:MAG: response regulator [Bryobacteraceae bacterium]